MYLIFFWVKREKPKKQTKKRKPVSWGKDAAGRRQTHTRVMMPSHDVSLPCLAVLPPLGLEAPTAGRAGAGMRGGRIQVEGAH